jgi:hypothetical protein
MKHKVKTHNWFSGTLRAREYIFNTLEEALGFLNGRKHHSAKVFNEMGELVHHQSSSDSDDMYA